MLVPLGDRMKKYEKCYNITLPEQTSVIVRVDGKSFHTWTKVNGLPQRSDVMMQAMIFGATNVIMTTQDCRMAYIQSDECSFLFRQKNYLSDPYCGNKLQKLCSLTASMFTLPFNEAMRDRLLIKTSAYFDSRVFILPDNEVCNYFIWRQQDATRNSIQSYAREFYSHKELDGKNQNEIQFMLLEKDVNWNDLLKRWKRGIVVDPFYGPQFDIPIFTKDRRFINDYNLVTEPNEVEK